VPAPNEGHAIQYGEYQPFDLCEPVTFGTNQPSYSAAWFVLIMKEEEEEGKMLHYALVFLIVGLIAGALGITGVAAVASQIAWVLFLIGVVLILVHIVSGRRTPTI
jgi:uncharacterized membrane protein YtjA (UPF0391 family)